LEILTSVGVSCRQAQLQEFIKVGFFCLASADPESASIATMTANQTNVRRRRDF
jgi:hypothetical protein